MNVKRRLFESHQNWLKRVLSYDDVAYAVGKTDCGNSFLLYQYPNDLNFVATCVLTDGPRIGYSTTTGMDFSKYSFTFHATTDMPIVSGVVPKKSCQLQADIKALRKVAQELPADMGYHVFTDRYRRRWFMDNKTYHDRDGGKTIDLLCDYKAVPFGGRGQIRLDAISEYEGEWHLDPLAEMEKHRYEEYNPGYTITLPVKKAYTLTEVSQDDDAAIIVLTSPSWENALTEPEFVKYYDLTLHLPKMDEPQQRYDIAIALSNMWRTEFKHQSTVIRENNIKVQIEGSDTPVHIGAFSSKRYYCTLPEAGPIWDGCVEVRDICLPRSFA